MMTQSQTISASRNPIFKTIIRYPQFNEIIASIDRTARRVESLGESRLMTLEGRAGAGKTTIIRDYQENYPRYDSETGLQCPVYYCITPSPVTVKGMAAKMLEVFGDPGYDKGTIDSKNSRLIRYIQQTGVKYVVLDEFQNLIDKKTDRVLRDVADWVKVLMKETTVAFVLAGIEDELVRVLDANAQLSRLCLFREKIQPFQWIANDPETHKTLSQFMERIEATAGYKLSKEVPRSEMLFRIHYATDGVVGYIIELMQTTIELLEATEQNQFTLQMLSQAFRNGLQLHMKIKTDPFSHPANRKFLP